MTKYCVACGFKTNTDFMVCEDCSLIHDVPECFEPMTCQDDVCYLQANGEINLDGDCNHRRDFYLAFNPAYIF